MKISREMDLARAAASEDKITKELPKIIDWLEALGLPARQSRYNHYEEIIDSFFRDGVDPTSENGQFLFKSLTHAYRECVDIYLVYKCFENVEHPNLIATLKKVVAGEDVPDLDVAGASRNFLFELLVAARFHTAGYKVNFDDTSDVVAERDGLVVRVECKRLVSEKQLAKRINRAGEQLATAMTSTGKEAVGLIYIDVSSCILPNVKVFVESPDDAEREIKAALHEFVMRNVDLVEDLNKKHLEKSYGTCLIGTLPIWTPDYVMHTSSATEVRAAGALSDERFELLKAVLDGFDETFTKLF